MKLNKRLFGFVVLALVFSLLLVACGGTESVEQAVEQAAQEVEDTAQEAEEAVEEAAQEVEEAVAEPTEESAAEEEMAEPTEEPAAEEEMAEPTEEPAAEEEAMAEVDYDTDIYGVIDEIDLEGTTVTFWHRYEDDSARGGALGAIIDEFNTTNPYGITVIGSNEGGYGDLYDKMIAGLTTGEVPGLIVAYQNQAAAYQVADGLVSLDPYVTDPVYGLTEEEQADFFQAFIDSDKLPQFGGQSFGWPPARSMEVMFYNSDYLSELGFDAPPQTPEEFGEMVCAARDQAFSKNTSDFTAGMEMDTDASSLAALVFARGGDVYDYANGAFTYNTAEAIEALTFIQGLVEEGCISQIAEKYGDQTDFGNGKILFTQGSSSGLPFYGSAVDDGETGGFAWSVAPIPYSGATPVQNIYGASTSVAKTDPATQLASWLFLKYWTSPESQAQWATASNYFPTRDSVAEGMSEYFAENTAYATAFDLLQYGKPEPPVAGYDNIRDVAEEAFIDIIYNGADAATALADLDIQANQILEDSAP